MKKTLQAQESIGMRLGRKTLIYFQVSDRKQSMPRRTRQKYKSKGKNLGQWKLKRCKERKYRLLMSITEQNVLLYPNFIFIYEGSRTNSLLLITSCFSATEVSWTHVLLILPKAPGVLATQNCMHPDLYHKSGLSLLGQKILPFIHNVLIVSDVLYLYPVKWK